MNTTTLTELFFDQLRDIHSAAAQLVKSMPLHVSLCTHDALRNLLASHTHQYHNQMAEISAIFEWHGVVIGNDACKAMAGLLDGGTSHLQEVESAQTRDMMMIAHCLRIQAYEMAAYDFTTLLAGRLGMLREPSILSELLAEEKEMAANLMLLEPGIFEAAKTNP